MTDRSRRAILRGTAGLVALSAGCLDEAGLSNDGAGDDPNAGGDPDEGDPGSAASDPSDGGDDPDGDGLEEYDAVAFDLDRPRDPDATLLVDAERARDWLADRGLDEDPYAAFVDDTSFDDSVLLGLEAEGRQLDYELALETVTVDDEGDSTLVVEATVRGESDGVSGQQMIGVGQLVSATFAGDPATEATVTIVDDDGRSHEQTIAVDSASEAGDTDD